ncbi:MAG: hypothetical protein AAF747_10530 [Planctomycetota bacterium]
MNLIGQADVVIDAKARLAVPSKFRAELPPPQPVPTTSDEPPRLTLVAMPRPDGTVWLYPESAFNELSVKRAPSLDIEDEEAELNRILFGMSERVTFDSQHRVTLPRKILGITDLKPSDEVTVVGVQNHMEIHPRERWAERERERLGQLSTLAARLAQRRRGL